MKKIIGFDHAMVKAIDDWRRKQPELPSRSEAIRRLVELGLASAPSGRAKPNPAARAVTASRAERAAGEQIDRALSGQPDDVKARRKRRLTKMPRELRKQTS